MNLHQKRVFFCESRGTKIMLQAAQVRDMEFEPSLELGVRCHKYEGIVTVVKLASTPGDVNLKSAQAHTHRSSVRNKTTKTIILLQSQQTRKSGIPTRDHEPLGYSLEMARRG